MRKIQEFLRAHCYDVAAYFISTTGLLFPRQAFANDMQRISATTPPVVVSTSHCITQQFPLNDSDARAASNDFFVSGTQKTYRIIVPEDSMKFESDERISNDQPVQCDGNISLKAFDSTE